MRLTAFFKLYKICILLHRCNLKIFAKKSVWKISNFLKIQQTFCKWRTICKTSPFRDRVAELRGPSEGLGGGCALLGCTAASRASVEQPIGTSRSSRSKRELVQFEMIQSDWFSILILNDHADLFFVNATTHQSTSSGERVVRRYPLKRETSPREIMNVNAVSDALTSELKIS